MKAESVVELTKRLSQLRDTLYCRLKCDVITGEGSLKLTNSKHYGREVTREIFLGTNEDWDLYQEARGIIDVLTYL